MVKIFQTLISKFFKTFLQAFLNLLVGKLNTTVLQIVQDVGATDWTSEEKRKEAIGRIKKIAMTSGLELKDSTIALATEIAVKIWKGGEL